ncbi:MULTISPECIES: class I SAM-dependent methyltransferase [unclassified Nocardia]|uniref:class I SAM-dependent methyltransferase n=1 Tax=unclassified Nocardia TaxID=2637762 RepID=UPI0033A55990
MSSFADDPLPDRLPTSHERQSGRSWDASYRDGPAPWDIGQPQPAVVRLAAAGGIAGHVLDVGCGTGDNALHLAALGFPVHGVDVAATAVAIARRTAENRGLTATFDVADALHLERLERRFGTVLDSGLFHTFDHTEQAVYARSLGAVVARGGTLYVLCFADVGVDLGPHPVSRADLTAAFDPAEWEIAAIDEESLRTRFSESTPAWLATVHRR